MIPALVIAAIVIGGTGALIAYKWDDIVIKWKGKKVVALGDVGTGKTTLMTFLSTGSFPEKYFNTVGVDKTSKRRFKLKDLDICLQESVDIPGNKLAQKAYWEKYVNESDVVIFLFDASKVYLKSNESHNSKLELQSNRLGRILRDSRSERKLNENQLKVFCVGTHCDKIPEYRDAQSNNKMAVFQDEIGGLQVVKEIRSALGAKTVPVIFGSLHNEESTTDLVYQILCNL